MLMNSYASMRNRKEDIQILLDKWDLDCVAIKESGLCEGHLGLEVGTFKWLGSGKELDVVSFSGQMDAKLG